MHHILGDAQNRYIIRHVCFQGECKYFSKVTRQRELDKSCISPEKVGSLAKGDIITFPPILDLRIQGASNLDFNA